MKNFFIILTLCFILSTSIYMNIGDIIKCNPNTSYSIITYCTIGLNMFQIIVILFLNKKNFFSIVLTLTMTAYIYSNSVSFIYTKFQNDKYIIFYISGVTILEILKPYLEYILIKNIYIKKNDVDTSKN